MQDRISAYPGRVKLTPVAGQADTYDLTRADQPTQEGTPLNKAALLSDTTVSSWQSGYPWDKEAAAVTPVSLTCAGRPAASPHWTRRGS